VYREWHIEIMHGVQIRFDIDIMVELQARKVVP
jgi:hypothetical protein